MNTRYYRFEIDDTTKEAKAFEVTNDIANLKARAYTLANDDSVASYINTSENPYGVFEKLNKELLTNVLSDKELAVPLEDVSTDSLLSKIETDKIIEYLMLDPNIDWAKILDEHLDNKTVASYINECDFFNDLMSRVNRERISNYVIENYDNEFKESVIESCDSDFVLGNIGSSDIIDYVYNEMSMSEMLNEYDINEIAEYVYENMWTPTDYLENFSDSELIEYVLDNCYHCDILEEIDTQELIDHLGKECIVNEALSYGSKIIDTIINEDGDTSLKTLKENLDNDYLLDLFTTSEITDYLKSNCKIEDVVQWKEEPTIVKEESNE